MPLSKEEFGRLKRAEMLTLLKQIGRARGHSRSPKSALADAYAVWLREPGSSDVDIEPVAHAPCSLEQFGALNRTDMLSQLARVGRAGGLSRARKAALVDAYAAWHLEQPTSGTAPIAKSEPPEVEATPLEGEQLEGLLELLEGGAHDEEVGELRALIASAITSNDQQQLGGRLETADGCLRVVESLGTDDPVRAESAIGACMKDLEIARQSLEEEPAAEVACALAVLHPARQQLIRSLGDDQPAPATAAKPSEPPPGAERRQSPRIPLEVDIGLASETNFYTGLTRDVSNGGIFVATYQPLPIGTEVVVSFVLPNEHHIAAEGRVAWVRESIGINTELQPGFGVAFDELRPADLEQIMQFVDNWREPMLYD